MDSHQKQTTSTHFILVHSQRSLPANFQTLLQNGRTLNGGGVRIHLVGVQIRAEPDVFSQVIIQTTQKQFLQRNACRTDPVRICLLFANTTIFSSSPAVLDRLAEAVRAHGRHVSGPLQDGAHAALWCRHPRHAYLHEAGARAGGGDALPEPRHHQGEQRE